MCGIFGVLSNQAQTAPELARLFLAFERMMLVSESRGKDSSGILISMDESTFVFRSEFRGSQLLRSKEYRQIKRAVMQGRPQGQVLLIGHTRMATHGGAGKQNNQPILYPGSIIFHNGIVTNYRELVKKYSHPASVSTSADLSDTHALSLSIADLSDKGLSTAKAIGEALALTQGANTFIVLVPGENTLTLWSSNGSLYLASRPGGEHFFGSEPGVVNSVAGVHGDESSIITVQQPLLETLEIKMSHNLAVVKEIEESSRPLSSITPIVPNKDSRHSQLLELLTIDEARLNELKRCNKCLIPVSFPFSNFSEAGICSLCRMDEELKRDAVLGSFEGTEKITGQSAIREVFRRTKGSPILVPLSGGRDSSYVLHILAKEMGLPVVAYTYDWGFVSSEARENISIMCGSLGVEHVLVAADIRKKRHNVRLNLQAWLRRPHLGVLPLLMAGDKEFFMHASKIRRERNLSMTVFSQNPLERTHFKTGFAGVTISGQGSKLQSLSYFRTLRLMGFYAKSTFSNPGFLNSSILDSVRGFYSYYFTPKDYIEAFDYLPWDEDEVNSTLIGEYGWRYPAEAGSTWRIGDSTAAFYNYAYQRIAGFNEFDTFRSNQIRSGGLTRAEAMSRLQKERSPRVQGFIDYCDAVGVDAIYAARRINEQPQLY